MEVKTDDLPEPFMWIGRRLEEWIDGTPVYSAAQMLAFAESCARMAREEAAKLCEKLAEEGCGDWKHATPTDCAAAIRKG